jgi:hyperosmotically inducible periplasmic protein
MKAPHILGAAMLAVALVTTTGCAVVRDQQSVGEYVDDATVTARVKARLAQNEQVSALAISVESMNGTVQLSGFARSAAEKATAERVAREVSGVRNVRNDIIVRAPTQGG